MNMIRKNTLMWASLGVVLVGAILGGAVGDRIFGYRILDKWFPRQMSNIESNGSQVIVKEESIVIDVAEKASSSVVTIGIKRAASLDPNRGYDPFRDFFGLPRAPIEEELEQDIGTGFVVSQDGLIVTNKHVVSDSTASYRVFIGSDKEYEVEKIYRDPVNDLAILKISANGLTPLSLGDSGQLKVGQFVIAIGTALGEFRNTVTTGVISGLGRGITAGSYFGDSERLDNVIQTDAAINPGNSGGPLLSSKGEVIGVNVAVASGAQNIGFAIPINLVKESIENFNRTGKFSRPYLGVSYTIIDRKTAILNELPQGAYVREIVPGSPAQKAGVVEEDIIIKINDERVGEDENGLAKIISQKKIGESVTLLIWRDGEEKTVTAILEEAE
jgi:serine protease Do